MKGHIQCGSESRKDRRYGETVRSSERWGRIEERDSPVAGKSEFPGVGSGG